MPSSSSAWRPEWLEASRAAATEVRAILAERPTSAERVLETGTRGRGGDKTLIIDALAEEAVFAQLDRMHSSGARFTAVSEERGVVDYGDAAVRVVIDPIDGSLNAKRGLGPHALSIAVSDGPTMADVVFGYVVDFGAREEWWARQGEGAWCNELRLDGSVPERRMSDGRLEVIALESAAPRNFVAAIDGLVTHAHRVRAFGAMALSLCQVAATRVDGMLSMWSTRSVDVAAAQLIVRESGGLVGFPAYQDPLAAPLDLEPHSPVIGARTADTLAQLAAIVGY